MLFRSKRDSKYFKDGERKNNAISIWNSRYAGAEAGSDDGKKRIVIRIFKYNFFAHRLAFVLMEKRFPIDQIDHIDGDSLNNKWENLRECYDYQNKQNLRKRSDNKSGYIGVYKHSKNENWVAEIRFKGKKHHIGVYSTPEEAFDAYLSKKKNLHLFQSTPR